MATLYKIDQEILNCFDLETGEILNVDKLSELQIERDTKIENVALWIKNLNADIAAYKAEKDSFAEKEKQAKTKVEGLKTWLGFALNGNKFNTAKVAVTFRKSEVVEVDEEQCPKEWMSEKVTFSPDKTAIKNAIKQGREIEGCTLIEKNNIQIK